LRARTRSDSKSRTFPSRESSRHSPWSRALCGTLSLWHSPAGSMNSATVCKCFGSTVKCTARQKRNAENLWSTGHLSQPSVQMGSFLRQGILSICYHQTCVPKKKPWV
jgi:hypothetical protein